MPELLNFDDRSVWINVAVFIASAVVVWLAGTRMVRLVDRLAERTGMGQGFAGMLLLGGIVSLTEISTVSTAAFTGTPLLALNNLLGSESINLFLLAAVDPLSGREALTSFVAKPAMLMQGTLVILLLSVVAIAMIIGDPALFGVGPWSAALFLLCVSALWLSQRYQGRQVWVPAEPPPGRPEKPADERSGSDGGPDEQEPLWLMFTKFAGFASIIFVSGFLLSMTGDALAGQTGLGTSFVGFLLVGISTSMPELSTITAAIRLKRYELAIGDILGSNVFNLLLIFLADVVYTGEGTVLNHAGRFEMVAALLGIVMTGILLLGLLERRDKTILKMGYDALAMILVFVGGVGVLYGLSGDSG